MSPVSLRLCFLRHNSASSNFSIGCSSVHLASLSLKHGRGYGLPTRTHFYNLNNLGSKHIPNLKNGIFLRDLVLFPRRSVQFSTATSSSNAVAEKKFIESQKLKIMPESHTTFESHSSFSLSIVGYQQGIMDFSREPKRMES